MSKLELIIHFYEYNEWANNRLLDVASGLSADDDDGAIAVSRRFDKRG